MNILNQPKQGMLLRNSVGDGIIWVIIFTDGNKIECASHNMLTWRVPLDDTCCGKACEIKWSNESDDKWRRVFEEETALVREWCQIYMWSGDLDKTPWYPTKQEAEEARDGSSWACVITREKQPDGTWKIVGEPKATERELDQPKETK